MSKIAILSSRSLMGFYEPTLHPGGHSLQEKGASVDDLSHHTLDYEELTQALKTHGFSYDLVSWSDASVDWSQYDGVLIHSPWDYYENINAFLTVLETIESKTLLLNSFQTIKWNFDKKYIQDAQNFGFNVIKTIFVDTACVDSVIEKIPDSYWEKGCIFKPTISAGANDVFLIKNEADAQSCYQNHFKHKHETLMIQPNMEEIKTEGEWSFVFFDGRYSHGVLKKTVGDGFGVKHSIKNQEYTPTLEMIAQASAVYERLVNIRDDDPLYTRLDMIKRADGKLYIMEIEQIEPYLYLHARPTDAADQLVRGIIRRIMDNNHV